MLASDEDRGSFLRRHSAAATQMFHLPLESYSVRFVVQCCVLSMFPRQMLGELSLFLTGSLISSLSLSLTKKSNYYILMLIRSHFVYIL